MIKFNTHSGIISLHAEYARAARWTAKDDLAGQEFNGADFRVVEIAMIRTAIRAGKRKTPIKWFRYFHDEIVLALEEYSALDAALIDAVLTQARRMWQLHKQGHDVDA
jgi:hypothetical protein